MENNNNEVKQCPRDCKLCSYIQRNYCAAQIALSNMDMIKVLVDKVDAIVGQINGLAENVPVDAPTAQEGEAVQTIDSPVTNQKKKNNELQ